MIRAFLALPLPEPILHRLSLAQHLLPLPRPVPREALHLTLVFLDSQPEPILEELHHALASLKLKAPELRLDGLGSFGGPEPQSLHARIAGDEGLAALEAKLARAARQVGIPVKARRFVPHVTLGRFRPGEAQPAQLARAMAAVEPLTSEPWRADALVMFRSTLRPEGPLYDPLADYPLG